MRRFFLFFIMISVLIEDVYALSSIDSFFELESNTDVVFYNSPSISVDDYIVVESLKEEIIENEGKVYSVIMADILPYSGNEYIILSGNENNKKITVYLSSGENILNYEIPNNAFSLPSKIELDSFMDKNQRVNIIKYYIMSGEELERNISLHMFRINEKTIDFIVEVDYYKEFRGGKSDIIVRTKNIFIDIDDDNSYEMILETIQHIADGRNRREYSVYKYNTKVERYVCIESSWENSRDYSYYFN